MRVYTLTELFSMTRAQIFALHDGTVAEMNAMPEGSTDRDNALENIRNIRKVLSRCAP